MNTDRIDFISAYCDSWCERCAFTTRCSHYAVKVATEMCDGDFAAAIELTSRSSAGTRIWSALADFIEAKRVRTRCRSFVQVSTTDPRIADTCYPCSPWLYLALIA